ncbi:adenylate/guanylate cyclase domain-containing protein [Bradyrhizobium tropiciagri]|uniref:adenylate/guanylate cyclase domain-containing protein n=1 Tax=Bradyrhizobium tropiciagri TaxID=312253 RepID=UPI000A98F2D9|nr:adenylate/guanylate cyclase domain-containing protein [Bradyrhizobium tropiciagri]
MQKIGDWLEQIGMSEYAQRFADNDIDFTILGELTDQDLRELGVSSLGHRRKLLRAIAEVNSAGKDMQRVAVAPAAPVASTSHDIAERRQVTVMFSDLVGSTALSARMDPEDLREVISAYQTCVAETVRRLGGFVAKYMGDGVLIYFGYPEAHEDDAERAVRAGLELVAEVTALKARVALQTRIGIATGLVVVGDLVGSGEAQERRIVGETPNLAARLQGIAEPNMVVIAESTRRLLGNLFELQGLGARELKGIAEPVRVWAALRASSVEGRFEALHATDLTAPVGREEELDLLLRRWAAAKNGEGQVVLLSGEAGIGKSRLAAALLERLASEPHTRLRYFCSPQHADSALYPIIGQMERAAGLAHDDTPQAKLDKLDAVLSGSSTSTQHAALFAEMLLLPNDGRYPAFELTPQQRRQQTLEALTAQIEALARSNPVLMIFEDAHWTDPTSLEAIGRAVDRIASLCVLLIVTFRPEFEPPWIERPHVTAVTLNRLSLRDVGAMIDSVVGDRSLPSDIREDIIERTDGIPLFVEEMTKAVLEAESEGDARRTALAIPSRALAVPATLQASLMARLDRLGPAKEVAQIGAAIGRQFSHDQLAAVVRKPAQELESALHRLIAAGLLFRQGVPPHATYLFKHALVQDAAYDTMLKSRRRQLHASIAKVLIERFPTLAEIQPEIAAHHFTQAGLWEPAVEWWGKAGERATHVSAYSEAIAHLEKALGLVEELADSPPLRSLRLRLQTTYGYALLHGRGQANAQTIAAFARARELAAGVEDRSERLTVFYGMWVGGFTRGDLPQMRELADAFLSDVQHSPGSSEFGIANRVFGITCWFQGDYAAARVHLEKALAAYDPQRDRELASRFGYEPGVVAKFYLALVLWPLGEVDRASALAAEAFSLALPSDHIPTIAIAHWYMGKFHAIRGKPREATPHARALLALAREHGLPMWLAFGTFIDGWVRFCAGDLEGEAGMRKGSELLRDAGSHFWRPDLGTLLAEAEAKAGRVDDALATLDAQLATIQRSGEGWFQAEVHRKRGELFLKQAPPNVAAAELAFAKALEIARSQQTRTFELRAALSLARLYQATGRMQAARTLLLPALVGFNEGIEVPEAGEARRLIAQGDTYRTESD